MTSRIVIFGYKPKPGKESALELLMESHVSRLRDEGLVSDRESIVMKSKDGIIVEIFEWKSKEAIESAHSNKEVLKMWQEYSEVCEYVPIGGITESNELFSEFTPLN